MAEKQIGKYRITGLITVGELGHVYQAMDAQGRQAVVRVLPEPARVRERFLALMAKLAPLKHPNLLETFDFGEAGGQLYQACEFVPDGTLHSQLYHLSRSAKKFGLLPGLKIMRDVALALEAAHKHGLTHGDVQPTNVLLRRVGESEDYSAKLGDFLLTQLYNDKSQIKDLEELLGNPAYMAPEQFMLLAVSPQTDMYSLGVMLYEITTGSLPFMGADVQILAGHHIYDPPTDPTRLRPELPQILVEIILKALAKQPEERFESVSEMGERLQQVIEDMEPGNVFITKRPSSPPPPLPKPPEVAPPQGISKGPRISICDLRGKVLKVFELTAPTLSIGRLPENNLVLDDMQVSRYHAMLHWDGKQVVLKDVGSTHPTLLAGSTGLEKLKKGQITWPWRSLIFIEPYWLRLDPPAPTGAQRMALKLESSELVLMPGAVASLKGSLTNLGSLVDGFALEVEGVPQSWLGSRPEVRLNPGASGNLSLEVKVPRSSEAKAGVYPVNVVVRSLEDASDVNRVAMNWHVLPFATSQISLTPQRKGTRSRAKFEAVVTNTGNLPTRYAIEAKGDPQWVIQVGDGQASMPNPVLNEKQRGMLRRWFGMLTRPAESAMRRAWERSVGSTVRKADWVRQQASEFAGVEPKPGAPSKLLIPPGKAGPPEPSEPPPETGVLIEPGSSAEIPVRVFVPPWLLGGSRPYNLDLVARPIGLPEGVKAELNPPAKAQLDHRAYIPSWLLPLVLLAGVVLYMFFSRPPNIEQFAVSDRDPQVGQKVVVNYKVSGARSLELRSPNFVKSYVLDPRVGKFELPGFSKPTRSENPIQLTLVAKSWIRQSEKPLTLTVLPPPPVIAKFSASATDIIKGQQVKFFWRVKNATSVKIQGVGDVNIGAPFKQFKPTQTQKYVLIASNGSTSVESEPVEVEVKINPPEIIQFVASPPRVTKGGSVKLFWKVRNTKSLKIEGVGDVKLTDPYKLVTPSQTQKYVLVANNGSESKSVSLEVAVIVPPAKILAFSVRPNEVVVGQTPKLTFAWRTQNAAKVNLSNVGDVDQSGTDNSLSAPDATTEFTLTATGEDGTDVTRVIVVTVRDAPPPPPAEIASFTVSPRQVTKGQPPKLVFRWSTKNAKTVEISNVGAVDVSGSDNSLTAPDATTEYTLTATGGDDKPVTRVVSVRVVDAVVLPPKILGFSVSPTQVAKGQSPTPKLNFKWTTTNATKVEISEVGDVDPKGSSSISAPDATTKYTLTATNSDGKSITKVVEVKVVDKVELRSFAVKPTTIKRGQQANLSWEVRGVDKVKITPLSSGLLTSADSRPVSPTDTTTYTLSYTDQNGKAQQKTARLLVTAGPTELWYDNSLDTIKVERSGDTWLAQHFSGAKQVGNYQGNLSGNRLAGKYTGPGSADSFIWNLANNKRTFSGTGPSAVWCGAKKGSEMPDGCGFQGKWITHLDQQKDCQVYMSQTDTTVEGTICGGGEFRGSVKQVGGNIAASGTWKRGTESGNFNLQLTASDALQFRGNFQGKPWCGSRDRQSIPSQCGL